MAIIDNTLAAQVPQYDASAPLVRAAKLREAEMSQRVEEFKLQQAELGAEARGLQAFVNTPEFPQRWAETTDRLAQKGILPPEVHAQWRNTPSPLLLKSIIQKTESPELAFRREDAQRTQANTDREFKANQAYRAQSLGIMRQNADNNTDYTPEELTQRRLAQLNAAGIDPNTPRGQTYLLTGNDSQSGENSGVYGTPIYGKDEKTGKTVLGVITKGGAFKALDTPGVTVTPGGITPLNTGAGYVPFDTRGGSVTGPIIPRTGDLSKDYAPTFGPDGAVTAAPIPGSPAAQEAEEKKTKEAAQAQSTVFGSDNIKSIIAEVKSRVENQSWYSPVTGFGAETAAKIPGTPARDTAEQIKTITANIGFDRLQRMRDESPTGGALGAIAVQELESLQKTIASLETSQSKKQFLANLKRVEEQYDRINKKASAYPNAAKHGFGGKPSAADRFKQLTEGGKMTKEQAYSKLAEEGY